MKIDISESKKYVADVAINVKPLDDSDSYRYCVKGDALRLANLHKESVPKYLQSILMKRNNPDSYFGLGVSYKCLGNFDKAVECLTKAIEQEPARFDAHYELGISYLLLGMPEMAIEELIKAIVVDSTNLEAQIQLALAHELVGEQDLAMLIYNKLIETKPSYLKAYSHKAALLICQGKYFEASKIFFDIIKLNADYYKAYFGMGVCFDNMNKVSDAKRYYRKFLDIKPNSKHADYVKTRIETLRKKNSQSNPLEII